MAFLSYRTQFISRLFAFISGLSVYLLARSVVVVYESAFHYILPTTTTWILIQR
uniref:Uncharacterized protein n=1 Tax=Octopus bimaculoides TaxID=37653 RepID=A0A0L8HN26_OCTBM